MRDEAVLSVGEERPLRGAQVRRQNSECGWQGGWRGFEVVGRGVAKAR